jgi:Helix-turn-helix domain
MRRVAKYAAIKNGQMPKNKRIHVQPGRLVIRMVANPSARMPVFAHTLGRWPCWRSSTETVPRATVSSNLARLKSLACGRGGRELGWGTPSRPRGGTIPVTCAVRARRQCRVVASAFRTMMRDDRERLGLSVARASWLVGASVPDYRELETGERYPDFDTWDRIRKLYGWPQKVRLARPPSPAAMVEGAMTAA